MTAAPPPELVIFCGIQATGKSTFFQRRLFHSHVRIGLDLVRTRHREATLLDACLRCGQSLVIDNTSPTPEERARYIAPARAAGFCVVGYYFQSRVAPALARNAGRPEERQVPERGVLGTAARLVPPRLAEGFDALHYVRIDEAGEFVVEGWRDEV
ncbi:AAA family ATPase [Nannocystis radixulma]|uniref:ATP-binding protein n=1 Tax=Nannocystis radixulma TaxID=2995305 RepID=A0ABT5B461_9BACT|nr:AAA family ATPase [Nannocystis radixulma]MDC0668324.1 ATP-binding protein [Nannocystis radixulma]